MAKYDVTYSCGHDGIINLVGPTKQREWRLEVEAEKLCPECYQEHLKTEREKANKEAAEKAKEMELPELTGTEKQVAWANTLRQTFISKVEKQIEYLNDRFAGKEGIEEKLETLRNVFQFILESKTAASYYIDNRSFDLEEMFRPEEKEMNKKAQEKTPEGVAAMEEKRDIRQEATVHPENCNIKVAAEITIKENKISVSFEKNDKFREIVKSLGYQWGEGYWYRELNSKNGTADDRAAELGNKLLNAGFPITIIDSIIRQNAIDGKFDPECTRWIQVMSKGDYEGWLAITWDRSDDLYSSARSLPGSKWSKPSVLVKVNYYKEVEEFAKLYSFKISEKAQEAIYNQKIAEASKKVVTPVKVKSEKKDGLEEILKSSEDILDDLKD